MGDGRGLRIWLVVSVSARSNSGYNAGAWFSRMTGVQTVKVSVSDAATRLDRWLATRFPDLSYGLVQKLLRTGQIRVDGARASGNLRLTAGQRVRIPPMVSPSPRSSNFNSKI